MQRRLNVCHRGHCHVNACAANEHHHHHVLASDNLVEQDPVIGKIVKEENGRLVSMEQFSQGDPRNQQVQFITRSHFGSSELASSP